MSSNAVTAAGSPGRWLLRVPAATSTARLFCFPYSGVGASMFNGWPRSIGDVEVCPIQLPGRENRIREGHYGTYADLAGALAEALLPHLDRPFAFFGHCAGALPAFETAVLLAERGLPVPTTLFASAQVAPHHCPHDRFLDLTDDELRREIELLTLSRGGEVHPPLVELGLAILREDLATNRIYRRPAPVAVPFPITVLHWSRDPEVTQEQLRGWNDYSGHVDITVVEGGHYDFLSAPPQLLDRLAAPFAAPVTK
ncbi:MULTISPECIES: thioesterase II family protein [unclassified Amycolatopsis]|uniref:thioesterase II family protein n=1 Tax=unclassified Amycolatopsis TaxID=2618356 RepID=UPI002106FBA3|nr:thioesterase domain-containing protein [Amycolatopsis sp. DSM 110486]